MGEKEHLYIVAAQMVADGKGILAADESTRTMDKRLEAVEVEKTAEMRRKYRQMLFTAPGIEKYLSGVILYDSSIRNSTDDGIPFPDVLTSRGIIPGIKVDKGAVDFQNFPGEVVTQGLDDLGARLKEYYELGARFAKWRAVVTIGDGIPTDECLAANAFMLTRYAAICQEEHIVPMVEPEVIMHGTHDIKRAEEVTTRALQMLFKTMEKYRVDLKAVILKSSMVLASDGYEKPSTPTEVADATLRTFAAAVPETVPGIVFLSGGQTSARATENLQEIASRGKQPWNITYSYSRAIEEPVLAAWRGDDANIAEAQAVMLHRVKMNSLAQQGKYTKELESE